jgi:hypothetical protein
MIHSIMPTMNIMINSLFPTAICTLLALRSGLANAEVTHLFTSPTFISAQPARYVKVSLSGVKALHIAEVQVFDRENLNWASVSMGEGGLAIQSSSHVWSSGESCAADYANDDDTLNSAGGTCEGLAWTQEEQDPWWMVDLRGTPDITSVVIYNRVTCCMSQLSHAKVELLDQNSMVVSQVADIGSTAENAVIELSIADNFTAVATTTASSGPDPTLDPLLKSTSRRAQNTLTTGPSPTSPPPPANPSALAQTSSHTSRRLTVQGCLPNARKVKIEASPGQYLQLHTVQVFSSSSGSCLAVGKETSQSSTLEDSTPALNAISRDRYSFSFTAKNDENAWWQLDLGSVYPVKTVYIGQQMCRNAPDPIECFCHLSGANVMLLDEAGATIANYTFGNSCWKRHAIEFNSSYEFCDNVSILKDDCMHDEFYTLRLFTYASTTPSGTATTNAPVLLFRQQRSQRCN